MQVGVVSSSQIGRYNRMDAGFHLAIATIAPAMEKLRAATPFADPPVDKLKALPLYALEPLKPLTRGDRTWNMETAHRAIDEYPIEAYLLVKQGMEVARMRARDKVTAAQKELKSLDDI